MGWAKKSNKLPPFAPLLRIEAKSPAFKALTNAARVTYMLLKLQRNYAGQEEVSFPYSAAEEYMTRHTYSRSLKQLERMCFISKSQYGGLYRRTNVFRFEDGWKYITAEEAEEINRELKENRQRETPYSLVYIEGVSKSAPSKWPKNALTSVENDTIELEKSCKQVSK